MLTALLAKVFGAYFIILGGALLLRRRYLISVFAGLIENRLLRVLVAIGELLAGLFIIFTHQAWSPAPAFLITLLGWLMAIEGALYLFLPDRSFAKLLRFFNVKKFYVVCGILVIILGAYLLWAGFRLDYFIY